MAEGDMILDAVLTKEATGYGGPALWAGAECTINRTGDEFRDQCDLSGHNARPDDLDRLAGLGISALRYPLLWESFASSDEPEKLWEWHHLRLTRLQELGVKPIVGLIHHGSGPPTTDLLSPDFAQGLADHAAAAATRFPWVQDWTPVNEPLTTARFSALYGHWYPHLRDERAFWQALISQIEATRAAMASIRAINPDARLIQTEDLGHTSATPELRLQAEFDNTRRWASWDLLAGRLTEDHPLRDRLAGFGFGPQLESLAANPCPPDVLGINHYLTSDRFLDHRTELHPPESRGECSFGPVADIAAVRMLAAPPGLEGAIRACWDRYGVPIALTEIHNGCTREEQLRWMAEGWDCASRLSAEGIAIEAVTAWSAFGSHDWNSLLTQRSGHYETGIFDIRGPEPRETALAPLLRQVASGQPPDHPVLGRGGWWRGHPAAKPSQPVLITGATGTLGQAFARACTERGIDHVLTDRATLDLAEPASVALALDTFKPWAVINCAGWVRVDDAEARSDQCMAANFSGAVALARACAERGLHYTGFSSDLVFSGDLNRPYVESDVCSPRGVYGASKALADSALQTIDGRCLTIRTASFFSPHDRHNFAVLLVHALRGEEPFAAAADCVTSPTYVPDLVRTTLDLIIDDEVGLWHVVNEGAVSWAAFAYELSGALRLPKQFIEPRNAASMGWAAARPRNAALSSERGLIMPPLTNAIGRFADAMRAA